MDDTWIENEVLWCILSVYDIVLIDQIGIELTLSLRFEDKPWSKS